VKLADLHAQYLKRVPEFLYRGTHSLSKNRSESEDDDIWMTPFIEHAREFAITNTLRYLATLRKPEMSKAYPVVLKIKTAGLRDDLKRAEPDALPPEIGTNFASQWSYLTMKLPLSAVTQTTSLQDDDEWLKELHYAFETEFDEIQ
jgi:hypothetical protein